MRLSNNGTEDSAKSKEQAGPSAWAPFRYRAFAVIWTATVVSNVGTWMYNLASGWLMLSLDPNPLVVSMVQVANSLPMFLFAIPAGALIDIVDRRRFLIVGETAITLTSTAFATLVWLHRITPGSLLLFSFIVSVGAAVTAPAWQAVVTQLVPKSALSSAVSANSAGINVSRAVGPALGGTIVSSLGIAAPFWFDAFSNIGVIAALIWWRQPAEAAKPLPPETFSSALRVGIRHARYNPQLRATLIRAIAFFIFASAYWALLPLVVRTQISGGASLYGILLSAIGAAAVCGALALPGLRARWGPDRLLTAATLASAVATGLFGVAHGAAVAVIASLIAGASWITALSCLNVSAQMALPEWVRGRGLAAYVTVMFGALTMGSALWGKVAAVAGLPFALLLAGISAVIAVLLTQRWKLHSGAPLDLSPSLHWPDPITTLPVEGDRGPVLVTVEYRIEPNSRDPFLRALTRYGRERQRDGAYDWGVFEDPAEPGRFIETFRTDSWLEHLRQHQRVTNADRALEDAVRRFLIAGEPKTTHLIGAQVGLGAP